MMGSGGMAQNKQTDSADSIASISELRSASGVLFSPRSIFKEALSFSNAARVSSSDERETCASSHSMASQVVCESLAMEKEESRQVEGKRKKEGNCCLKGVGVF